jgi:hypothetical protein
VSANCKRAGFPDARLRELYRDGRKVPSSASVDVADLTGRHE